MNRSAARLTLPALALTLFAGAALAQPADAPAKVAQPADAAELPSGWDVLDRAVEASGGVDTYMKIKNFVAKGSFSMPAMGIQGTISRTQAAPGKLYMRIDLGDMGEVVQATDGETAWMIQPGMTEPVVLPDEQAQDMIESARFYVRVQPREKYESAEVVGVEDVNGDACYRVNLKEKGGKGSVGFYSVESGHQLKSMSRSNPEAESFDVVVELSDFREVDGLVHPFAMKQRVQTNEFSMTFESFEHDATIDDSIFSPPAAEVPEGEI